MAPKNKFTKQQLIDAAFFIASEEGLSSITIRKIAERLGSSIAPIYGNYKDVEELKSDVVKKAFDIQQKMIAEKKTGNTFLDMGVSAAVFAREYPLLFEEIILKDSLNVQWYTDVKQFALDKMKLEPSLKQFDDAEREQLLLTMQAFQIGLSVLAGNKSCAEFLTDEKILEMLKSIGAMVQLDMKRTKKSDKNQGEFVGFDDEDD